MIRTTSSRRLLTHRRGTFKPLPESLENRTVPSTVPTWADLEPNDSAGRAGMIDPAFTRISGRIGEGESASADVDWYRFELLVASRARFKLNGIAGFHGTLSIFQRDPVRDPLQNAAMNGLREIWQSKSSTGSEVSFTQGLSSGEYFVAVSGLGNDTFHPLLANSGMNGDGGTYTLQVGTTPIAVSTLPRLLSSDPKDGSHLTSSPLAVSLRFDRNLPQNHSVHLLRPNGSEIDLAWSQFRRTTNELQLVPSRALPPGKYQVRVQAGATQLAEMEFRVTGHEGSADPQRQNDTAKGAINLGRISTRDVVQRLGWIGDSLHASARANDVDLYRFEIQGNGRFGLVAEVFASRIGSNLDGAVSLFRQNEDGSLDVVDGDYDGSNPALSDPIDGKARPVLRSDPFLNVGLEAGVYFLAVSSGSNAPVPRFQQVPGEDGIFDPNKPNSGTRGNSVGEYTLQMRLYADNVAPRLVQSTPSPNGVVSGSPTELSLSFSEPLKWLHALQSADQGPATSQPIWISSEDSLSKVVVPILKNITSDGKSGTWIFPEALRSGTYEIHINARSGLTDFAGFALAGTDPASGDFSIPFQVTNGRIPFIGPRKVKVDGESEKVDLGVIFPTDANQGIDFVRLEQSAPAAVTDEFSFQLLEKTAFQISLLPTAGSGSPILKFADADGNVFPLHGVIDSPKLLFLNQGAYRLLVESDRGAAAFGYQFWMRRTMRNEVPQALSFGASPATRLRFQSTPLPNSPLPPSEANPRIRPVVHPNTPPAGLPTTAVAPPQNPAVPGSASFPVGLFTAMMQGPAGRPSTWTGDVNTSPFDRVFARATPPSSATPTTADAGTIRTAESYDPMSGVRGNLHSEVLRVLFADDDTEPDSNLMEDDLESSDDSPSDEPSDASKTSMTFTPVKDDEVETPTEDVGGDARPLQPANASSDSTVCLAYAGALLVGVVRSTKNEKRRGIGRRRPD